MWLRRPLRNKWKRTFPNAVVKPSHYKSIALQLKPNCKLLAGGFALLLGIAGTQGYGYLLYGAFPANPLFVISILPSSFFLEANLTGHSNGVSSVAVSSDGQTVVSGSLDNTIKIWNLKTGVSTATLTGHSDWVTAVAISPNGQTLVSGSLDKTIKIWDLKTGTLRYTLRGHIGPVTTVAISRDGQTLVSGSADRTVKIWRLPQWY